MGDPMTGVTTDVATAKLAESKKTNFILRTESKVEGMRVEKV